MVCVATGGAAIPLVGTVLISSGIYCGAKASIRGVRELVDEHDVQMFYVYYNLDNKALKALNFLTPEWFEIDFISSGLNIKLAHCKAWFTTSATTYVTFEITAGKDEGVISVLKDNSINISSGCISHSL